LRTLEANAKIFVIVDTARVLLLNLTTTMNGEITQVMEEILCLYIDASHFLVAALRNRISHV